MRSLLLEIALAFCMWAETTKYSMVWMRMLKFFLAFLFVELGRAFMEYDVAQ